MKVYALSLLLALFTLCSFAQTSSSESYPKELNVITRADWGAKKPVLPMTKHKLSRITIHHTATKQNRSKTVEEKLRGLQNFSQNEGKLGDGRSKPAWPDVPYHFYITVKGEIAEGRDVNYVGDTNTEYDPTGHILVTLEGNFENEQPSPEQMMATEELVVWLAKKYKVTADKIAAHKDFAKTACPGKSLYEKVADLQKAVKASK